jgi:hypothetical protein
MAKPRGYVVWQGPSELDGSPVVLIATRGNAGSKANRKTGALIQTYILRSDVSPIIASQTGLDGSICGECPHRPVANGTCYVRVDTGPTQVWKAYKAESKSYARHLACDAVGFALKGAVIRLGSYGDPAAIPLAVWRDLLAHSSGHTGYTHQWARPDMAGLARYCMASCDTPEEDTRARALGWRTFTIVSKGAYATRHGLPVIANSFLCPASEEGGRKLTCTECLACDGTSTGRKASVYIPVHGVKFKVQRFAQQLITIGGLDHA